MRKEINFRAKSLKDGTWHYGFVIPFADEIALLYERSIDDPTICGLTSIDVDQNTVGQFTGLYDKDGQKIFEGDIIGCENPKIKHLVFYNEKQGRFCAALNGNTEKDFFGVCGFDDARWNASKKVIGNIFDNPHLFDEKWKE